MAEVSSTSCRSPRTVAQFEDRLPGGVPHTTSRRIPALHARRAAAVFEMQYSSQLTVPGAAPRPAFLARTRMLGGPRRASAAAAPARRSASFAPGEVVALVGENGAGKSTLLKVLAAVVPRDGGHATLNGRPYDPRHQRDAEAQGVSLVFQELNVNRSLSIAENVMLGRLRDFRRFGLIDWRRLHREAQAILDRIGAEFSVRDDVTRLDLGQVKTVEVARALATNPRFVFFDESTAFLSHAEASRLMHVIRELKAQGIGVAFVSHHLHEVIEIADRLVVLKDGALVGSFPAAEMTEDRLHQLMVGRDLAGGLFPAARRGRSGPAVVTLDGVRTRSGLGPVSLELRRGEVLAWAA
jgi:ABC-type sugar transport system ATPase subunit